MTSDPICGHIHNRVSKTLTGTSSFRDFSYQKEKMFSSSRIVARRNGLIRLKFHFQATRELIADELVHSEPLSDGFSTTTPDLTCSWPNIHGGWMFGAFS
ncbi:hypothetical protein AVEN_252954-1 [Araneus ventricosus]|uniref:Uncharacterized protein n=1 Tax=Araneus ventricosus TaxID=182803 RepID=A0A4Y2MB36_ARAVE|nr:hypothetical protein AVEN_252954-1 [Araneus ventricosus]